MFRFVSQGGMKSPFLSPLLFYVCGIILSKLLEWPLCALFAATLALGLAALSWEPAQRVLLGAFLLFAGCLNLSLRTAILSPHDLRVLAGDGAQLAALRGTLLETPVQRVFEHQGKITWRTMAELQVQELRRGIAWQHAIGTVAVSTPGVLDSNFFAGQPVEVSGILRLPSRAVAPGLFDYRAYLESTGIYYQLAAEGTNDWQILSDPASSREPPVADRFRRWAQANLAKGLPEEDEPLRLLWAMTLGWKTALTDEVAEPFMQSGTLHIFAISGLHVALIAGILVSVLRVLQIPRPISGLLVVPMLWFYAGVTGWQASAVRSTLMMSIVIGGWALKRPSHLLNSLLGAGFILLLWEPRQLFHAGFQLSFFVVLSIAVLLPPLEKYRREKLEPDPFLPSELRPCWKQWLDAPLRYVTTAAVTSLAAWLGSLPLIAHYFHLVTPVNLLANLLIVPLSGLALMASLGSLCCGAWSLWLTELFNHSGWFWMTCLVEISQWSATLPGAYFYVRPISFWHFATYYPLLVACASGWLLTGARRQWAPWAIGLVILLWAGGWLIENRAARLTILPLGGSGLFADFPGSRNDLLIDSGDRSAAEFLVQPFLRAQGMERLPQLLLTHGDVQHVGGTEYLVEKFRPKTMVTSSLRFRSPNYRRVIGLLEKTPETWRRVHRGDWIGFWKVLHPAAEDRFSQADDGAVVLWGELSGVRILLLSDLGSLGLRTLLEREPGLKAEIVIAGLPAQSQALPGYLIEQLDPRVLIVASAEYPASAKPKLDLLARLRRWPVPVLYTHEAGAVTLVARRKGVEIQLRDGEAITLAGHPH